MTDTTWLWWAPLAAAALHIVEEFVYPGGFAEWDRAYRPAISSSITPRFHVWINAGLLLLCTQVALLRPLERTPDAAIAVGAWLALAALLFSNAIFHVAGTIRTGRRSPGVVTGVALYVPMAIVGYWWFLRSGRVSPAVAVVAALVGGSYHLWAGLMHSARARSGQTGG
jgi:hypothetical protein